MDMERNDTASSGNFWALLQFRATAGDSVLRDHLAHAPRNAVYTSPDVQNQIIEILGDYVLQKILRQVQHAQFFTLIADEVTDFSNKEQLGIVLRYVNDSGMIREDLVTGVSGRDLADKMLSFLRVQGVDLTKLRGQAYDVVKSLNETNIRNMMGVVDRVWVFFSSHPKRQRKLEEAIETTQPESKDRFEVLHPSIVQCMETISDEGSRLWTPDAISDSRTLLLAISTADFLSALVIANACLQYLLSLTRSLQAEAKDIVEAITEIKLVVSTLKKVREEISIHLGQWFVKIEQMCDNVGVEPSLPRLCARQRNRSNVPAENVCEYYRRVISVPLLDHLISELESRFSSHKQTALQGLYLVPAVLSIEEIASTTCTRMTCLQSVALGVSFIAKWKQLEQEHGQASLPKTPSFSLPHASSLFPNIKVLLQILCTLPVTSCSAERNFSGFKTPIRSTMGNERLSSLSLHRDICINVEDIVDTFAS